MCPTSCTRPDPGSSGDRYRVYAEPGPVWESMEQARHFVWSRKVWGS